MARRLRFTRKMRLVRSADFARAYREGSRARGAILVVVAIANDVGATRLGLSVGRSIWRRATRRNRVRRIFREAFRLSYGELPVGFDLVLIPAEARLEPGLEDTRRELVRLSRKAAARCRDKSRAGGGDAPLVDAGGTR
jgi:ribonuclease P protein component